MHVLLIITILLGLEDEGMYSQSSKSNNDVNIWTEINSSDKQNIIIDTNPVTKTRHFLAGSLNILIERLTSPFNNSIFNEFSADNNEGFTRAFLA